MITQREILGFIGRFAGSETVFTSGCCYWFAHILASRFTDAVIVLAVIENHFVTRISGRLYDVTGDVTEKYSDAFLVDWSDMANYDELEQARVLRDCVLF